MTSGPTAFGRLQKKRLLLQLLAFAALLAYGLIVDPDTGRGGIPCIWKAMFGFECPGCGLSRAGALLLRGRLAEAVRMNWLIFPFVAVLMRKFLVELGDFMRGFQFFRTSERSPRWQS